MRSAIVFILLSATPAIAGVIRQPADLSPGDQYRIIFVTSEKCDATSTDIEDYSAFAQATAGAAPEVGKWGLTWKVLASTEAVDARDNTSSNPEVDGVGVLIYRLDGTLVFDDYTHMWDHVRINDTRGLRTNEFGTIQPPSPVFEEFQRVWTRTSTTGVASLPLGNGDRVLVGAANLGGPQFMSEATGDPSLELPFYAISEVVTFVPEPSGGMMMVIGLSAMGLMRKRR